MHVFGISAANADDWFTFEKDWRSFLAHKINILIRQEVGKTFVGLMQS